MVLRYRATQPSRQSGTGQGAVTSTRHARAARRNPTTVRARLPGRDSHHGRHPLNTGEGPANPRLHHAPVETAKTADVFKSSISSIRSRFVDHQPAASHCATRAAHLSRDRT